MRLTLYTSPTRKRWAFGVPTEIHEMYEIYAMLSHVKSWLPVKSFATENEFITVVGRILAHDPLPADVEDGRV